LRLNDTTSTSGEQQHHCAAFLLHSDFVETLLERRHPSLGLEQIHLNLCQ